jgi:hypothetical protein
MNWYRYLPKGDPVPIESLSIIYNGHDYVYLRKGNYYLMHMKRNTQVSFDAPLLVTTADAQAQEQAQAQA